MEYSLTVMELKEWVNSIPKQMDYEQVDYLHYQRDSEPVMAFSIMFKKKLNKQSK